MKLLLTSNGLSNPSISSCLEELVGKTRHKIKIAFIPTAAFASGFDKNEPRPWLADDMYRIKEFCGFFDVVSLADLDKNEVVSRLEFVDVIFVGGGNAFYLSYCMDKVGLFEELPRLLESRVYAGISAGSMIATTSLRSSSPAIEHPNKFYDEDYDELGPIDKSAGISAKLVNFLVRPHYKSKTFPNIEGDYLENIVNETNLPLYAIDDNSAVKVVDDQIEVISEGEWKLYSN